MGGGGGGGGGGGVGEIQFENWGVGYFCKSFPLYFH